MVKRFYIFIFVFILSISFIAATNCNISAIDYTQGDSTTSSMICTGSNTNGTITVLAGNYVSLDSYSINGNGIDTKNFQISLNPPTTPGSYNSYIFFNDGLNIPINITIPSNTPQTGDLIVFPTSKVVTVQQGYEKTQNILITVPSNYPESVTIQSVDFNPGTETILFGDLNLGQIAPGQSVSIPIIFSGIDAQVGTYSTSLSVFAIGSSGQISIPNVNLQLQVTAGVSPVTNGTFSTRPSCSLTATTLNLNETQTFTCSNVVNNLKVSVKSNEYLEGLSADLASGIYTYRFRPIKFGVTDFVADFTYQESAIFIPFRAEVIISSSGSANYDKSLKLAYDKEIQNIKAGEEVIVQIVDNVSNSLVDNPELYINSRQINNTGKSFYFTFDSGVDYEIRAISQGYNDYVGTFRLEEQEINLFITPEKLEYYVNEEINVTVRPNNVSLKLDGTIVFPGKVILGKIGNMTLLVEKEGYETMQYNFSVINLVSYTQMTPELKKWGKNVAVDLLLEQEANWEVFFQEWDAKNNYYKTGKTIASGSGDEVSFKIPEEGMIIIKTEGQSIIEQNLVTEGGWSKFKAWFTNHLLLGIVLVILTIVIIYFLFIRSPTKSSGPMFETTPQIGD